jgi:hypothetical protein
MVGLQYHTANKVCGDFGEMVPTAANIQGAAAAAAVAAQNGTANSFIPTGGIGGLPPKRKDPKLAKSRPPQPAPPTPQAQKEWAPVSTPASLFASQRGDPYSHLTPERRGLMDQELKLAEDLFAGKMQEAKSTIDDPKKLQDKLESLKNSFATKQSIIRKKYGVRLRERRSRAVMAQERQRMGLATSSPMSASGGDERSAKRARVNGVGAAVTTQVRPPEQSPARKRPAAPEVGNGLSKADATAANVDSAADPSVNGAQRQSYQHGALRVVVHQPGPSAQIQSANPATTALAVAAAKRLSQQAVDRGGSESRPVSLASDSGDSDSDDDDGDIPAELPPLQTKTPT